MVRAKMECLSREISDGSGFWDTLNQKNFEGELYHYKFQVVVSGSPENYQFFGSTPGGVLELWAVRNDLFEPGQYYYLDFTKADK